MGRRDAVGERVIVRPITDLDAWLDKMTMPEPMSGCWFWTGAKNAKGYGKIGPGRYRHLGLSPRTSLAHRAVYELLREPIPDGLQIDHKCRVHSCVNPAHLEVVSNDENQRRSRTLQCRRGHPWTEATTYLRVVGHWTLRWCRQCRRDYYHERIERGWPIGGRPMPAYRKSRRPPFSTQS